MKIESGIYMKKKKKDSINKTEYRQG